MLHDSETVQLVFRRFSRLLQASAADVLHSPRTS